MTARFIIPFMMMPFLLLGASSTSWVDMELKDLGIDDIGGGGDADVSPEDAIVITNVTWTANEAVSLLVCFNASLGELQQNVTSITLNGNITGDLDDSGLCASFDELDSDFKLSPIATMYTVDVQFSNNSSREVSTTFAMTVVTTLLDCDKSLLTKVSWANETTELLNPNCIEKPEPLDLLCYHIGDLSNQALCFTVPNDGDPERENITVCLIGPTDSTANITSDEGFSVNFLQYGEVNGVSPSLSLNFSGTVGAVIVETDDGNSTVHRCYNNTCRLPMQFMPSRNRYQVCGDLDPLQTATTTFHDLQVIIFETAAHSRAMEAPPYLQFVFANALPDKTYSVSLWQQAPPGGHGSLTSDIIDCTEVATGHGCFGVLSTDSLEGEAFLAVANAYDGTNQVIVPYSAGIATTAELTSSTEPTTSTNAATTTPVPLGSHNRRNSRNGRNNYHRT